jgi:hypothetical protein
MTRGDGAGVFASRRQQYASDASDVASGSVLSVLFDGC